MGKQVFLIFLLISILGFICVFLFWPTAEKLPVLDKIESFELDDVHKDLYISNNDKVKLVSFFYTNCPDVCPLTMMDFQILQNKLKNEGLFGHSVELIAITLDPKHDTKEVIRNYAQSFDTDPTGWKWLRGTEKETKNIANDFQMQYQKIDGDYMTHSVTMYLIDEDNQLRALYDMASPNKSVDKDKILEEIKLLTKDKRL
jgi:protein SCO1